MAGEQADTNRDGVVEATEGVSLVQVSGNASASSFVLKQGYVASGPWQYSLYSFTPGTSSASQRQLSGSGNAFWDYRLANSYVCEGVRCASRKQEAPRQRCDQQ
ncbi:autotransporter outer membrane beta-barrel domain-containing protein [Pantoea sp. LMR881]|nr:autotransporter outer membrane beta-barrel domain-containing protein [Pantoea sp. LMR881]